MRSLVNVAALITVAHTVKANGFTPSYIKIVVEFDSEEDENKAMHILDDLHIVYSNRYVYRYGVEGPEYRNEWIWFDEK